MHDYRAGRSTGRGVEMSRTEGIVTAECKETNSGISPLDQKIIDLWVQMDRTKKERILQVMERLIRHQGATKSP